MSPTPLSVLQAAVVAQFVLAGLVFLAGGILWKWGEGPRLTPIIGALTCFAIFAILFLVRDHVDVIFWGLLADLILIAIVVARTGGSEISCFVPLYAMLPTYAVVVAEPVERVGILYAAAAILFVVTFFFDYYADDVFQLVGNKAALGLVTIVAFGVTYYLELRSHDAREMIREELYAVRSKYEVGKSLEDLYAELASVDYDQQRRILDELRGKHVNWTVRFENWYAFGDSKTPDPKTLKFAIRPPASKGHSVLYGIKAVDLNHTTSYPPSLERGESYDVEGILVREGYSDLAVLALSGL